MRTVGLYFHTLRYLKSSQVTARLWSKLHRPAADLRPPPPTRSMSNTYVESVRGTPTLVAADTFRFLNVERRCSTAADWHPQDAEKLWIYNLHYFDDLNAQDAASRAAWHVRLLERWVAENPPAKADAWEPYPTSRRIVNWVKWSAHGFALLESCRASLAVQARWLARNIEHHILGNHLFTNAKALVHAGLYFQGEEADSWLREGLRIIERELPEQVLLDGGHFELSPMYHAAALEDLLDLVNLLRAYGFQVPVAWIEATLRMRQWLRAMTHPDGEIAFFNDCAFDIAPNAAALTAYASRLRLPELPPARDSIQSLAATGYMRAQAGPAVLICDCGHVGPDYIPGHAHADTLSFELSVGESRVFVNSGTSLYGASPERLRQRGTAAHNTVVVDGQDSSEVWSGFRVARRAGVVVDEVQGGLPTIIDASHDGYRRLPGRNLHRRRWSLDATSLCIDDTITGRFDRAEAFLYVHPEAEVRRIDANSVELSVRGAVVGVTVEPSDGLEVRAATWHPGFGRSVASRCIVARLRGPQLRTRVTWSMRR